MSEAHESRVTLPARAPRLMLFWALLAASYLAASAGGYRTVTLAIVGLMIGAMVAMSGRCLLGLALALILSSAFAYCATSLSLVVYLPPIAGFAFMAFFFWRTLRPGSEPLITRVARKEHPDLPVEIACYTRTLTWIWAGCFAFLLAVALLLVPMLPLHSWSRWMQGLGIVLPMTLFLGEYVYRHHRLRDHRHGSLLVLMRNIVAVIKEAAIKPAHRRPE